MHDAAASRFLTQKSTKTGKKKLGSQSNNKTTHSAAFLIDLGLNTYFSTAS